MNDDRKNNEVCVTCGCRWRSAVEYEQLEQLEWKYRALCRIDMDERSVGRSLRRAARHVAETFAAVANGLRHLAEGWNLRRWDAAIQRRRAR